MTDGLKKAWAEVVQPLLRRPPECQVAALCCRDGENGPQVLLITSRDTGRWIIPKGWLMEGKSAAEAAQIEAWEEAGVQHADLLPDPIGSFSYDKRLDDGYANPVKVQVFRLNVSQLADIYPEVRERRRAWVPPSEAAEKVDEPELKAILRDL